MLLRSLSSDIEMAASHYNTLTRFEHQRHHVSQSLLNELGILFVRHNMHHDFGLCLLHRHYDIPNNSVMVHSKAEKGVDICQPEKVGLRTIQPCAFFSPSREEFLPFEYETPTTSEPSPVPNDCFLSELASFLWSKGLDRILGFSRVSPSDHPWSEALLFENKGTIASQVSTETEMCDDIATEWAFVVSDTEGIYAKCVKTCKEQESGGHVRQ